MHMYVLDNECNFIYMVLPTVEHVHACVYDVGEDKIILATVFNANPRPANQESCSNCVYDASHLKIFSALRPLIDTVF